MTAKSLPQWFIINDRSFGTSLIGKDPETQGRMICEKYGFNYDDLVRVYVGQGPDAGDAELLNLLNKITE